MSLQLSPPIMRVMPRVQIQQQAPCRELCSLVGVVKLVCVTAAAHMEPAVRKACVLQLSPAALADATATVHHFMANAPYALEHGTAQGEVALLARVAKDLVPTTADWFMRAVDAQVLHLVATWPLCEKEARRCLLGCLAGLSAQVDSCV